MPQNRCRLYLVTPPIFDNRPFGEYLKAALGAGDVACVQLRLKNCTDDTILSTAELLLPICQEYETPLLINDRPDLAVTCGADGAHVGQQDTSYEESRKMLGPNKLLGVTCHDSRHLAITAADSGADYVAFGAFFETGTKATTTKSSYDLLAWWSDVITVPCVAIGGITPENCSQLVQAGADFLAVVSAVWDHRDGPEAGVIAFNNAIEEALRG